MYSISIVWFTLLVIVISSGTSSSSSSNDGKTYCDGEGWEAYRDDKCYKLIKHWATRDEAKSICAQKVPQADGSIAQMATIKSVDEQIYLTELVFNKSAVTINVWIGAKRLNDNKFEWEDGSEVGQFTNWAEGCPTDKAQQSCVVIKSEHMRPTGNTAGEWRNVPCDAPNYVLCEKLPRWSTKKLQQTLLDTRNEVKDSNAFLVMELDVTNEQLESTINELNITKNQLSSTNSELANTKYQLTNTNNQLTTTKNQLSSTIIELTSTKNQLTSQLSQSTARLETQIRETKNILVPIGFLYTQLPNEKAPSEIWHSMRWADVSSAYAGAFFRVDGGGSAPFGQVQSENTQRLTGIQSDGANCNLLYNVRTVIGGWSQGGYSGGWDEGNVCLKFEMSGGEIRPRNMAIRVWRRTG